MAEEITRRRFIASASSLVLPTGAQLAPVNRSFWVLRLLCPEEVIVRPSGTARLHYSSKEGGRIVEPNESLTIGLHSSHMNITGPGGAPVALSIEIPNAICRAYFGTFEFMPDRGMIAPVVTMDCEVATGSVVGAELPTYSTPLDALAAQAVVSRSVICGSKRLGHGFADFCDTTHCQFLRAPPPLDSDVQRAVFQTAETVLVSRERIMPARYSAACGGATVSGFDNEFQYFSVPCEICRRSGTARRGHGWGLCQEGAIELARKGWTWRAILAKYYPNASVLPQSSQTRKTFMLDTI